MVRVGLQLCEDDELPDVGMGVPLLVRPAACAIHALLMAACAPVAGAVYRFVELCCEWNALEVSYLPDRDHFYLSAAASAAVHALLQRAPLVPAR